MLQVTAYLALLFNIENYCVKVTNFSFEIYKKIKIYNNLK